MSGDQPITVTLAAEHESAFAVRAVRALSRLPFDLPSWALTGGVAVTVRLAGLHRPTVDVDTVSADATLALEMIGDIGTRAGAGVTIDGMKLDVMDVSDGDADHAHFLAHRLGLDTAGPHRLRVISPTRTELATATLRVATPGALVAMKLHALPTRRAAQPEKIASDIFDIFQLVNVIGAAGIASGIREGGPTLTASSAEHLRRFFIEDVTRSRRALVVYGRTDEMSDVTDDNLEAMADGLLRRLHQNET